MGESGRTNGWPLKAVVGGIVAVCVTIGTAAAVAFVQQAMNDHDRLIRQVQEIEGLKAQIGEINIERGRIAGLAAERGKEIPALREAVTELQRKLSTVEMEQARRGPYFQRRQPVQ